MAKCSFCSELIEPGTGKIVVQKTGKINFFCSQKCEKNMHKLGRDPRDVRWVSKKKK